MDELFGELRSLLQQNNIEDKQWREQLCTLLEQGWERDQETYQAQWLPYLAGFAGGWKRFLKSLSSLEDLERWATYLPQHIALLELDLWNNSLGAEGAVALASSEYLCEAIREPWRRAQ